MKKYLTVIYGCSKQKNRCVVISRAHIYTNTNINDDYQNYSILIFSTAT